MPKQPKAGAESSVYSERFTARVNKEGDHHEVILRGETSQANLVLRNTTGAKGFRDGVVYEGSFTEVPADPSDEETDDSGAGA